uniref:Pre-mRNA-splicing factor 38 n=1 Tax=Panagrolaimus sp. JU765 TaxID=591449 RepID=A0AC34RQV4_9BILA
MANRTQKEGAVVKGRNPQNLIEKIIRHRIYESVYWKEECFGLSSEQVIDKGVALRYIGGVYGGNFKVTPFLCLTLKLLQLQPGMANRTQKEGAVVKGRNPQNLIEKIIRHRIYESVYWKEECFGLSSEQVIDKGVALRYIGGVYGGNFKVTPFLCLTLKLLQLQPEKDIIIEFIRQDDFKYIRALGAFYIRLTFTAVEIYKYLEPLYNDYRKLRYMNKEGKFELLHMDEFIDNLLRGELYLGINLPHISKRQALEEADMLDLYVSVLDKDLEEAEISSDEEVKKPKPRLVSRRSRSRSPKRSGKRDDKTEIQEANALRASLGLKPLEP